MTSNDLHGYLEASARATPDAIALEESGDARIDYQDLDALSDRVRDRLIFQGVGPGDRVGLCLPKTIDTVAAIFGILKCGAAYVPTDSNAPMTRAGFILADCDVRSVFVDTTQRDALEVQLATHDAAPALIELDEPGGGNALRAALADLDGQAPARETTTRRAAPADLAYILYTSGSTGKPKGVILSHQNAIHFVDWCSDLLSPSGQDCFSSHAPFHFDLSILDLYTPAKHGARLILIPEDLGKEPGPLATLISEKEISIWYSAPSILSLLARRGELEQLDFHRLRFVLFAGEVFPVAQLRALTQLWPTPRYANLYGPTETNVCTAYEIPLPIPEDRTTPYPVGPVCSHLRGLVIDPENDEVKRGDEGELCIAGGNVMQGYWNLPDQSANAFLQTQDGTDWYRTGDLVVEDEDAVLSYVGRRDRMIKKRGYRIELGEIESCLYTHPQIVEASTIAIEDKEGDLRVRAHIATLDGERLSLIALKRFCSERLPLYMVPDLFRFHAALPKTSTDKVDYQQLTRLD